MDAWIPQGEICGNDTIVFAQGSAHLPAMSYETDIIWIGQRTILPAPARHAAGIREGALNTARRLGTNNDLFTIDIVSAQRSDIRVAIRTRSYNER